MASPFPKKFRCLQCRQDFLGLPVGGASVLRAFGAPVTMENDVRIFDAYCSSDCYETNMQRRCCPWRQVMTECALCRPLSDRPPDNGAFQFCSDEHMDAFCDKFPGLTHNPMSVLEPASLPVRLAVHPGNHHHNHMHHVPMFFQAIPSQ